MDRRERLSGDFDTAFLAALEGWQSALWTALPGVVEAFDPSKMIVSVQPTIQAQRRTETGVLEWVTLPLLVDLPVVFPGGGGFQLTFPIQNGDEALVVFSSRCIDSWWDLGGVQVQAELRMHDLSDGFALVGVRSKPRALSPVVSLDGVELRNDANTARIRIGVDRNVLVETDANVSVNADGDIYAQAGAGIFASAGSEAEITAPTIKLTGNVTITGNLAVSGAVSNDGVSIGKTHKHSGVSTGAGNTGNPI